MVHRGHLPEKLLLQLAAAGTSHETKIVTAHALTSEYSRLFPHYTGNSYLSIIPGFMPAQAYLVVTDTNTPTKFQVLILLCF